MGAKRNLTQRTQRKTTSPLIPLPTKEGAESSMGVLSAGFCPGTAGDDVDIPKAQALDLLFNLFPAPDFLREKDCVASVKVSPEIFVEQGFGVIVLHPQDVQWLNERFCLIR